MMKNFRSIVGLLLALVIIASHASVVAQTRIKVRGNSFSPAEDVKLGLQAADQAQKKLQLLNDAEANAFVRRIGERLVLAIPAEFNHPEFQYSFRMVADNSINAFALPGGPMFVNAGVLLAAGSEDEVAGVMAHELSHVVLRHGTAQASLARKYQAGLIAAGIASVILGNVIGGRRGEAIAIGGQVGAPVAIGLKFLQFSREFESEADILGAQLLANAGYEPAALAVMFKRIADSSTKSGTPGFLSNHPSPEARFKRVVEEAEQLGFRGIKNDQGPLASIKKRLAAAVQSSQQTPSSRNRN